MGLILTDDHQSGCRRGCGGNGAKGQDDGHGKDLFAHNKVEDHQGAVHQKCGSQGLEDTDHHGGPAGMLQAGEAEFAADGEGDKAQGGGVDHGDCLHALGGDKSQSLNTQSSQTIGADDQASDQVGGDIGEIKAQLFKYTCQHQAGEQGNGHRKKYSHDSYPLCIRI